MMASVIFPLRLLAVSSHSSPWVSSAAIPAVGRGTPGLDSDRPRGLTFVWIPSMIPTFKCQIWFLISDSLKSSFPFSFSLSLLLSLFLPLFLSSFSSLLSFTLSLGLRLWGQLESPPVCIHLCHWQVTASPSRWTTTLVMAYDLLNVLCKTLCSKNRDKYVYGNLS